MIYHNLIKFLVEATIDDLKKLYGKLPDDVIEAIVKGDPTSSDSKVGNFVRQALDLYKKDKFDYNDSEVIHDIFMALDLYSKSKNVLAGNMEKYKDIKNIDSVKTLHKVYHYMEINRRTDKLSSDKKDNMMSDVVFENENWKVVIPLDYTASIALGRRCKASWCTASSQSRTMYDQYVTIGDLYIFINKHPKAPDDIAYQYARRYNGEVEFKPNTNQSKISDAIDWDNFKTRTANELSGVFTHIATEESKIRSNPQYRTDRLIERYKTSKSPYIALAIFMKNPDRWDELKMTNIEYTKPFRYMRRNQTETWTTLKFERELFEQLELKYPNITNVQFNSSGFGTIVADSKSRLITLDGEFVQPKFDHGFLSEVSDDNFVMFKTVRGYGIMNTDYEKIIDDVYLELTNFDNFGKAYGVTDDEAVVITKDGHSQLIVDSNELVIASHGESKIIDVPSSRIYRMIIEPDLKHINAQWNRYDGNTNYIIIFKVPKTNQYMQYFADVDYINDSRYTSTNLYFLHYLRYILGGEDNPVWKYIFDENGMGIGDPDLISVLNLTKIFEDVDMSSEDIEAIVENHEEIFVEDLRKYKNTVLNGTPIESIVRTKDVFPEDSNIMNYLKYVTGEYIDIDLGGFDYRTYSNNIDDIIFTVEHDYPQEFEKINKLVNLYADENEIDVDDVSIGELIDDDFYDLRNAFMFAIESGYEAGTMNAIYDAYITCGVDWAGDYEHIRVYIDTIPKFIAYHKEELSDYLLDSNYFDDKDLSVPQYEFDGYDDSAAVERFLEELDDIKIN